MSLSKNKLRQLVLDEMQGNFLSGSLSSLKLPLGFIYDDGGAPQKFFANVPGASKIYNANDFFRSIENGRRFKAWVKQNEGKAKSNFEDKGVKHHEKIGRFKEENVGILFPEFYGDMNSERGVLYHEEAGTDVDSIADAVPAIKRYIDDIFEKKGNVQGTYRDQYNKDVKKEMNEPEKKLRKLIREEIANVMQEDVSDPDDVDEVQDKVHELWRQLSIFNTKVAEKYFQDVATDLDSLQTTWDKSGEVKTEWMQIKRKFNNLIEDISRYKSFLEETMNSQEVADIKRTKDGYYRVDRGGDYYAT